MKTDYGKGLAGVRDGSTQTTVLSLSEFSSEFADQCRH